MGKSGLKFDCPVCGKHVYRYPSEVKKGCSLTCSRACRAVLQKQGEYRNCETCGKQFYARKSQIGQGFAKFCSKTCSNEPHKNGEHLNCLICNKSMYRTRYEIERGKKEMFTNWQKREWKGSECAMCGSTENLELDHIVPRFAGGKAKRNNAQTLCRDCNRKKYYEIDLPKYDNLKELAN